MKLLPLGVLAVALLAQGCGGPPPAAGPPAMAKTQLLRPRTMPQDFMWRQRIDATFGERKNSFEAVVQKTGDTLQVLGLGPMGTRAFVLTLKGERFSFENHSGRELPFSPRVIVADIQRAFFPLLAGTPPEQGERTGEVLGAKLVERFGPGGLLERRFYDAEDVLETTVSYGSGMRDGQPPEVVTLRNSRHGYELQVTTLSAQKL